MLHFNLRIKHSYNSLNIVYWPFILSFALEGLNPTRPRRILLSSRGSTCLCQSSTTFEVHYMFYLSITPKSGKPWWEWNTCPETASTTSDVAERSYSNCRSRLRCRECPRTHHTLLHGSLASHRQISWNNFVHADDDEYRNQASDEEGENHIMCGRYQTDTVSLRVIPVWLENTQTKKKKKVNALLDDGADMTVIATCSSSCCCYIIVCTSGGGGC